MGFSLIGFAGGIAEGLVEKIEKEEKLTSQVLASRIEKAQEAWNRKKKEESAYEEQLREQLSEMQQLGVGDANYQKAFLTAPDAFQAYKKAKLDLRLDVTPEQFLTLNKDKLPTGTVDEMISTVKTAKTADTMRQTAKIIPSGGALSMTDEAQRRRLEQFAGARGMSLQDVAEAEGYGGVKKLTPAASINFDALQKPEKLSWKQSLERRETTYADASQKYGSDSPEAKQAKESLDAYRMQVSNLRPGQLDHAEKISFAKSVTGDPSMKVTPEVRQWAETYVAAHDKKERDEKVPSASQMLPLAKWSAQKSVYSKLGGEVGKGFVFNQAGEVEFRKDDPRLVAQVMRAEQEGVLASVQRYINEDGTVSNLEVRRLLESAQIKFDESGRPVLMEVPEGDVKTSVASTPNRSAVNAPTVKPNRATPAPTAASAPDSAASAPVGPGRPETTVSREEQAARDKDSMAIWKQELVKEQQKLVEQKANRNTAPEELARTEANIEALQRQISRAQPKSSQQAAPAAQPAVKIPADAPRAKSKSGRDMALVDGKWIYVN